MLLPGFTNSFEGVVGGTFDTTITLYQGVPASVWGGIWQPQVVYVIQTIVVASNAIAYISSAQSQGVNPVGDLTGTWTTLTPLDLTAYTGAFQINPVTATPNASGTVVLGGSAGTATVKVAASALAPFAAGEYPCYLQITDGSGDVYYPVIGRLRLINPI